MRRKRRSRPETRVPAMGNSVSLSSPDERNYLTHLRLFMYIMAPKLSYLHLTFKEENCLNNMFM